MLFQRDVIEMGNFLQFFFSLRGSVPVSTSKDLADALPQGLTVPVVTGKDQLAVA